MSELTFILHREPWRRSVGLWIRNLDHNGPSLAEPIMFKIVESSALGDESEPALRLREEEAQHLMDALWAAGFKPSEGHGSAGQLGATERHLDDMRRIVFDSEIQT